jgi:hypothetical protein
LITLIITSLKLGFFSFSLIWLFHLYFFLFVIPLKTMTDISTLFAFGSHRALFTIAVVLAMAPISLSQTDTLPWQSSPYAAPQGKATYIESYPVVATTSDWSTLIVRIVTQYFLWWLPDLFLMVLWRRQPVKVWLKHSMRKVFFSWRPGAVFVQSCQPMNAIEAYKIIDDGETLPGLLPMLFTLATDGWTLASGGLSVYTQWVTSNSNVSGWSGMYRFYNPIVPSIVSFISIITALCKTSNKVRIYLTVIALIIWPAIYLPIYILHDSKSKMYILEIMVFILQLNPFLIVRLELISMVLIGLERVFILPIVSTANIKMTAFPFPALNTWAFGGPLLILGIVTLLFAEAGMLTSALEIINYLNTLQAKISARFSSKSEERRPDVLPRHQVSDELIDSIINSPSGKDDNYPTTPQPPSHPLSVSSRNAPQAIYLPSRSQPADLQITSLSSPTLTNTSMELQSRSPPPTYTSTTSTPRPGVQQLSPVHPLPSFNQTDNATPHTQPDIAHIYRVLTGRNMDGAQVEDATRRNI